jgi:hypothetical protein
MDFVDYCLAFFVITLSAFLIWIMVGLTMIFNTPKEPIKKRPRVHAEASCLLDDDGWHNIKSEMVED